MKVTEALQCDVRARLAALPSTPSIATPTFARRIITASAQNVNIYTIYNTGWLMIAASPLDPSPTARQTACVRSARDELHWWITTGLRDDRPLHPPVFASDASDEHSAPVHNQRQSLLIDIDDNDEVNNETFCSRAIWRSCRSRSAMHPLLNNLSAALRRRHKRLHTSTSGLARE